MSVEFQRNKGSQPSLNLTPLIDVIFQLLVFFMLTSSFTYPALRLDLPRAESKEPAKQTQAFVLSLDASDQLYLNRKPITIGTLAEELQRAFAEVEAPIVHFRGDAKVPYARFVDLMQAVGEAGAAGFYLIHAPESGE